MSRRSFIQTLLTLYLLHFVSSEPSNNSQPNASKCPSRLVINTKRFFDFYLLINASGSHGLFPPLLMNISKSCCVGQDLQIDFVSETSRVSVPKLLYRDRENLEYNKGDNTTLSFHFPVHTAQDDPIFVYKEFWFVEIMKSPGPAFIMLTEELREAPDPSTILIQCWPIFLLLIIMAWVVGIIGWFLDHRNNTEQFPRNFYQGSWAGFWWAMVTMTTVGYGDKAPLSFAARLLTILWMITGTIVTSLFTANVTSVLTTKNVAALQNVMGQKVGVLNSKHFFQREVNEGASFVEFYDEKSFMDAFKTKIVSRALVPNYLDHLYFSSANSMNPDFVITNIVKRPFSVGLGLVNDVTDNEDYQDFLRCWEMSIMNNYEESGVDYSDIDPNIYRTAEDAKSLLNQSSILKLVYGLLGLLSIFLITGSLWEMWKYKRHSGSMESMEKTEIEMTKVSQVSF